MSIPESSTYYHLMPDESRTQKIDRSLGARIDIASIFEDLRVLGAIGAYCHELSAKGRSS